LNIESKVEIIYKYVLNEEVVLYFAACDVVVLPYISANGSGAVQLAYEYRKPVITIKVGSLNEDIKSNKTAYVVDTKNPRAIASSIIDFYKKNREEDFISVMNKHINGFSWANLAYHVEKCIQ